MKSMAKVSSPRMLEVMQGRYIENVWKQFIQTSLIHLDNHYFVKKRNVEELETVNIIEKICKNAVFHLLKVIYNVFL